jgi:hypothetical protein
MEREFTHPSGKPVYCFDLTRSLQIDIGQIRSARGSASGAIGVW